MGCPTVLACGPSGFAGASQAMCSYLGALATVGIDVRYVGREVPAAVRMGRISPIIVRRVEDVTSGAIGAGRAIAHVRSLDELAIAERLVSEANGLRGELVIWAHYLFPYGVAARMATEILRCQGREVAFWLTPTGSDVWEVAPQIPTIAGAICSAADRIVVYSSRFADEVATYSGPCEPIVIPPCVNLRQFGAISVEERVSTRERFGVARDALVVTTHSNLRPVKRPRELIEVVADAASAIDRSVILLVAGPTRRDRSHVRTTEVRHIGFEDDAASFLAVSDCEVNLSFHDSFNLSIAEAMARGVAVATTDVAGVSAHVERAGAGVVLPFDGLAEADRHTAAVQGLAHLLVRPDLVDHGSRGHVYAQDAFAEEEAARRLASLFGAVTS